MNTNLLMSLIFSLVLVVYLSWLLPQKRLEAFGDFIVKVCSVLPITQAMKVLIEKKKAPASKRFKR